MRVNKYILSLRIIFLVTIATGVVLTSCEMFQLEPEIDPNVSFTEEEDLLISAYIAENDSLSELDTILKITGLDDIFSVYGNYTFFAPDNNAFNEFYAKEGKSSHSDFSLDELEELVMYHVLLKRVPSEEFKIGIVDAICMNGDQLVVEVTEENNRAFVNKSAEIILKDLELPNGYLHRIDKVIDPLDFTVFGWLKRNKNAYSILVEALELTQVEKELNELVTTSDLGNIVDRTYSFFAIPDSVFAKEGINSFDDFANLVSPDDSNYSSESNYMKLYLRNLCITNEVSISDFPEENTHYPNLAGMITQVGYLSGTAEIVINKTDSIPDGLGLNETNSNNICKNGIIHNLSSVFQVALSFKPAYRYFSFCDYPGIPYDDRVIVGGNYHQDVEPTQFYPSNTSLDPDQIDGITWEPYPDLVRIDNHLFNDNIPELVLRFENHPTGKLDVTWDLPTIVPGKYNIYLHIKFGPNRSTIQTSLDGEDIGLPIDMSFGQYKYYGKSDGWLVTQYEIKEAKDHKLRIRAVAPGQAYFGGISFDPI